LKAKVLRFNDSHGSDTVPAARAGTDAEEIRTTSIAMTDIRMTLGITRSTSNTINGEEG
jgi:hypothetical protein